MIIRILVAASIATVGAAAPATAYNTITLETPACSQCRVYVDSNDLLDDDSGFYQLSNGRATIYLDERIKSYGLLIYGKNGRVSGPGVATAVGVPVQGVPAAR